MRREDADLVGVGRLGFTVDEAEQGDERVVVARDREEIDQARRAAAMNARRPGRWPYSSTPAA